MTVPKLVPKAPSMFRKTPSYLTRKSSSGAYYLKLPIPPALRHHFPDAKGKPRTHIVQALGTTHGAIAEQRKRPLLASHWAEFRRLAGGGPAEPRVEAVQAAYNRARELREARAEVEKNPDEYAREAALDYLDDAARDLAEGIEPASVEASNEVYRVATSPDKLTLLEALKEWNAGSDIRESTKARRELGVRELLSVLRVPDCLPEYITDDRATAYVRWLNAGDLGKLSKQSRVSTLHVLWRYLARRRLVPKNASPWVEHDITDRPASARNVRAWTDAELLRLFAGVAEDGRSMRDHGRAHYTRPLMLELYALGLLTGARLNSLVALTPSAVQPLDGEEGYRVTLANDKTEAGERTIPVVHPVAVSILRRRVAAQPDARASLFPECRPGGKDNRVSHHVSKAMGRDRDRLGFGEDVDFHSTRRCFATVFDNQGIELRHVERYFGHRGGTLLLNTYSDGSNWDNLLRVARSVRYSSPIEAALVDIA